MPLLRSALPVLLLLGAAAPAAAQRYLYTAGGVAVYDTATQQTLVRRSVSGCFADNVAFRPGTTELFALCGGTGFSASSEAIVVDPSTLLETAQIMLPAEPQDIAFTPDGRLAAIALANGYVAIVDGGSKALLATVFSGTAKEFDGQIRHVAITPDGRYVFCTNPERSTISAIDLNTFVRMFTLQETFRPWVIAVTPDGSQLLVVSTLPSQLDIVNISAGTIAASIPLGGFGPDAVITDALRNRAYVVQNASSTPGREVAIVDLNTRSLVGALPAPNGVDAVLDPSSDRLYVGTAYTLLTYRLADGVLVGSGSLLGTWNTRLALAPRGVTPPTDSCTYSAGYEESGFSDFTSSPSGSYGFVHVTANPDRCTYTVQPDVSWITVENAGVTFAGSRSFSYSVAPNKSPFPRTGHVIAAGRILTFAQDGCRCRAAPGAPFGAVDTPAENSILAGAIAFTGWALDDNAQIQAVQIYRSAAPGETVDPQTGLIFVGSARTIAGARPDVQALYPTLPYANQAGFGAVILTNAIPDGQYVFVALASDGVNTAIIGQRAVRIDNTHSLLPFGTIDVPDAFGSVSGVTAVFGWALAAPGNFILGDGSTMDVYIDNVFAGHPAYGDSRPDVQQLFPWALNASGAGAHFVFDSRGLTNGLHTLAWVVRDQAGHTAGIGSRFFIVANP